MASYTFFQLCLLIHLIGLILFAGAFVVHVVFLNAFRKQYQRDRSSAVVVLQSMTPFSRLIGIGLGIMILSGIGMMALVHGVVGEQLWFRIKFGLVIGIILIRLAGRKQGPQLRKIALDQAPDAPEQLQQLQNKLTLSNGIQLLLLFTILLLSVFKFN